MRLLGMKCAMFMCLVVVSAVAVTEGRSNESEEVLAMYLSYSTRLEFPEFTVEYKNIENKTVDISEYYAREVLILDGKEYRRLIIRWGGISTLPQGETWKHTIALSDFLTEFKEDKDSVKPISKFLLTPGKHTLILKFGGYQTPPILLNGKLNSYSGRHALLISQALIV